MENKEEKELYKKASKRLTMRKHFMLFLLVNVLLWLLWIFLFRESADLSQPVFKFSLALTLIWGLLVYAHYLFTFCWGKSALEKEVDRLRKKEQKKQKELESLQESAEKSDTEMPVPNEEEQK